MFTLHVVFAPLFVCLFFFLQGICSVVVDDEDSDNGNVIIIFCSLHQLFTLVGQLQGS